MTQKVSILEPSIRAQVQVYEIRPNTHILEFSTRYFCYIKIVLWFCNGLTWLRKVQSPFPFMNISL